LTLPPLIAVAHGSKDPRAAATVAALMELVRSRAGLDARAAFLGHCVPSLAQALAAVSRDVVLVPLLLTAAYHSKSDLPAQAAAALLANGAVLAEGGPPRCRVRQAATLGPHPLLIAGLERRLAEAGVRPGGASVVLAAAGSSDPQANEAVAALAARWQAAGRWRRVVPAYASAASPSPAEAVRALGPRHQVAVATYLLAPGYFADKIETQALEAGAVAVSAPLGAIPEVANVIIDRYEATLDRASVTERTVASR
jgi:sirohydrochlorin ferrochelatase